MLQGVCPDDPDGTTLTPAHPVGAAGRAALEDSQASDLLVSEVVGVTGHRGGWVFWRWMGLLAVMMKACLFSLRTTFTSVQSSGRKPRIKSGILRPTTLPLLTAVL